MYIDSRSKVFGHLDRLAAWKEGSKPAPVTVEWDLSNRCALGCQDCHFAHTHVRGPWATRKRELPMVYDRTGDIADAELVKRGLVEMREAGVLGVVWSGGGEPTTHPQLGEVVEFARALGFEQGMYTFGGLVTSPLAKALARSLSWAVVSLDCVDAQTYSAEKGVPQSRFMSACLGVELLVGCGLPVVGVSFLLHEKNWREYESMLMLARRLGATYATFRPAIRTSPADPATCSDDRSWVGEMVVQLRRERFAEQADVEMDLARFEEYRDWKGRSYETCYGIRLNAVLTPDGRVWLCPQRRGIPGSEVGDLRKESFAELWARHPGQWTDFSGCRVMCRLHLMNETLAGVYAERQHEAFL